MEQRDVIIIGAGLAGLAAGKRLREQGRRILIVEARDRVGGRVHTDTHEGVTIDYGAQWIGPHQHRMHELVNHYEIETFPTFTKGKKLVELAGKISKFTSFGPQLSLFNLLDMLEMQITMSRLEILARRIDPAAPETTSCADSWDSWTVEEWKRRTILSKDVRGLVDAVTRVVFGAEPRELSLLYFLTYMSSGGGLSCHIDADTGAQKTRFLQGAGSVPKALAEDLKDDLLLQAPVTSIHQDGHGVTVTAGGTLYRAERVIVALAPALAGRIAFEPALPQQRTLLCERMPMGNTVKCMAVYETPFWREQGYSGEAVSDQGPVAVVFDNSPANGKVGILLGFVVGAEAYAWGDLSERQRRKCALECFARFFGADAGNPVSYTEKNWGEDPWARGCPVGVMGPGVLLNLGPALRKPVGRVHWAGTETATQWAGYMEGAVESGYRAATEVLEAGVNATHA